MKHKQAITAKRPSRSGTAPRRYAGQLLARPVHKRVLLHPFTVMVLLCVGVLLAGATLRSFATPALNVTATVEAVIPSSPASITAPLPAQHVNSADITVSGTCPAPSYVKLFRNAVFSGVSQCTANAYHIQTSLAAGANELTAQVYSLTDQPGPAGTPVTVYYDATTQTPPAAPSDTPTTMWVSNVESAGYRQGSVLSSSDNPTVSGWAPPWSMLTITFHSDPQTCVTQANDIGWWSCTLDRTLPAGLHHVAVVAVAPDGKVFNAPEFQIRVNASLPNLLAPKPAAEPLVITADYRYLVHVGHLNTDVAVQVVGGTLPYHLTADWGDGTTTTLEQADTGTITLSHAYPKPAGPNKDYPVLVRATDADGQSARMQLSVVVKGNGLVLLAKNTSVGAFLDAVHRWLWLIWPAYVVVVLMAIGYYLGEREEYQRLMAKRKLTRAARAGGKAK